MQKQNPDWSIVYTLALASAAAFLAAGIGMWTYSFINRQSQEREFNRDIEVRYFENIYGPLFEELWHVADQLEAYESPSLEEWPKAAKSRFEPVVPRHIKDAFARVSTALTEYDRHWQKTFDAAGGCVWVAMSGFTEFASVPSETQKALVLALQSDRFFMFDEKVVSLNSDRLPRFYEILKDRFPKVWGNVLNELVKRLKPLLIANPTIVEHNRIREDLLKAVVQLRGHVLERMKPLHEP